MVHFTHSFYGDLIRYSSFAYFNMHDAYINTKKYVITRKNKNFYLIKFFIHRNVF